MAPLVALAGCQVFFGVELPVEDAAGAGGGGSGFGGGQAGAAMCDLCGAFFDGAPTSAACVDNGPPSSFTLANSLINCLCRPDTCGQAACKATCETDAVPSQACRACGVAACEAEVDACSLDNGKGSAGGGQGGGSMGSGGGGTGGAGPECMDDTECTTKGVGSLCVAGACTASSDNCAKAKRVVIDDNARRAPVVAGKDFSDACYYKSLDDAFQSPQNDMHVVVTAEAVSVGSPLTIDLDDVTLEGQSPQVGQPVALTVPLDEVQPRLTLAGSNVRLKGFALDGNNDAPGVAVTSGSTTLEGPFRLRGLTRALSVEGTAKATVVGTEAAPVTITENARGVLVGGTAGLEMTGEGGSGLVVEKTSAGAGLLIDAGDTSLPVAIKGVVFRANMVAGGPDGAGAVDVRRNRQVLLEGCAFEKNQQSITLNAQNTNSANIFLNVRISGNNFSNALPSQGQGAVVCGSEFVSANTKIQLEPLANTFPTTATACATIVPAPNCTNGVEVGYDVASKAPALFCPISLAKQRLSPSHPELPQGLFVWLRRAIKQGARFAGLGREVPGRGAWWCCPTRPRSTTRPSRPTCASGRGCASCRPISRGGGRGWWSKLARPPRPS
jgi:hypothetical protein